MYAIVKDNGKVFSHFRYEGPMNSVPMFERIEKGSPAQICVFVEQEDASLTIGLLSAKAYAVRLVPLGEL